MTSKQIVKQAIKMAGPPRVPLLFFNKDIEKSDVCSVKYREVLQPGLIDNLQSEWGFSWKKLDDTMGQPEHNPIRAWQDMEGYKPPYPDAVGRYDEIPVFISEHSDKYLMGSLGISGFNMVTFIRGFENTLEDLYLERDNIEKLIDIVFGFEKEIIRNYGKYALDAVAFCDDWGTQASLMISPSQWRELFKPRYREQFDLVHSLGMDVYFHSCGYVYDIIPDLIEIGVDVLNLNQPDLLGIDRLGRDFGGKVCFNCPVDHQTVAIRGNRKEIFEYVHRLNNHLGCFNGGFIGYIEEYHSIGMSRENYCNIVDAFESLNR